MLGGPLISEVRAFPCSFAEGQTLLPSVRPLLFGGWRQCSSAGDKARFRGCPGPGSPALGDARALCKCFRPPAVMTGGKVPGSPCYLCLRGLQRANPNLHPVNMAMWHMRSYWPEGLAGDHLRQYSRRIVQAFLLLSLPLCSLERRQAFRVLVSFSSGGCQTRADACWGLGLLQPSSEQPCWAFVQP